MPSIYALKRKHKKLQEEYDLKSEELDRLRKAHTIETDPSDKFKYEKQIKQREEEQKQLEQELEELEYLFDHPEEIPPFQWDYSQLPLDFSSKIEFLTQYFVGRQEAVERIDQFLQDHKSGYLAIVGEAGIGKSALLAKMVKEHGAVHHFVDDKQNTAKDEVFLHCIVEQLRQKYGFEFEERTPISVSEWNIYFQKWMKEISTDEKLVICVDALDEAQHYGGSDNLLKYLPQELPENVYFILTSRPEFQKEDITFLDSTIFECYDLKSLTQVDIEAYLAQRSIPPFVKGDEGGFSEIAAILYQKSEGNPLYLYYLLQECDDENLTLKQVNQLPQGLMKFYEKQWKERIWIGDKATKEGHKQILCLLLLLKEPASEEMLLELTDFDWAEIQDYLTPLRRFMRTGDRYELFHDSFKNFVFRQFEQRIPVYYKALIERLWNWQKLEGTLLKYVLFWLPTHLLEAKQYNELFILARETDFRQAQTQAFPDTPDVSLHTIQTALQGAADADKAVKMAEFLLAHERQLLRITQESPLNVLRSSNLKRAWELADLFEIERCVLLYLLLAWELKETDRLEEARLTLERLREKTLPRLWGLQGECAAYLLTYVFEVSEDTFTVLQQRLLKHDKDRLTLCKVLSAYGHFVAAREIVQRIDNARERTERLQAIAQAQAQAGERDAARITFAIALATAQRIEKAKDRAWVLRDIAQTQAQAGERDAARITFAIALATAQRIEKAKDWAWVLRDIAQKQAQAGAVVAALETIQKIDEALDRARVLLTIAKVQTQSGEREAVRITLAEALETTQKIDEVGSRTRVLWGIAQIQAQVEEREAAGVTLVEAFETAQEIDDVWERVKALREIARTQAQAGEGETARVTFAVALETVQELDEVWEKVWALLTIAEVQVQVREREAARVTLVEAFEIAQEIDGAGKRIEALREIAQAQAQAGESDAMRVTLAEAFEIAKEIDGAEERIETLQEIAQVQVQAGEFAAALKIAQEIDDAWYRAEALREIAQAQAQAGEREAARMTFAEALKIAQKINAFGRANALQEIALAQAQAGEWEAARMTFAAAFTSVKEVDDTWYQAVALRAIADVQVRAGAFAAALKIAQRISEQAGTLRKIAQVQAQAGEFAAALKSAQKINDACDRAEALRTIALAQAQAGEREVAQMTFTMALKTVQRISLAEDRAWVLLGIAQAQAQAGEFAAALKSAQKIEYWRERVWALQTIAQAQAQAEEFAAALKSAQKIVGAGKRIEALQTIALAQAQAGERKAARVTFAAALKSVQGLRGLDDIVRKQEIEKTIAQIQVQVGEIADAFETVQRIEHIGHQAVVLARVLGIIAESQAQAGEFTAALETAQKIDIARERTGALQAIALMQAQVGEREAARRTFVTALKTIQKIKEAISRVEDLKTIAQAQAQVGFGDQAVRTAEMILTERNKHLPEIAETLVEVGDNANFKRLLIPCASYLDAAYRMCGLLARLYPEQASAIAKFVISQEEEDVKEELDVN